MAGIPVINYINFKLCVFVCVEQLTVPRMTRREIKSKFTNLGIPTLSCGAEVTVGRL
jgi:hypothetical protein